MGIEFLGKNDLPINKISLNEQGGGGSLGRETNTVGSDEIGTAAKDGILADPEKINRSIQEERLMK